MDNLLYFTPKNDVSFLRLITIYKSVLYPRSDDFLADVCVQQEPFCAVARSHKRIHDQARRFTIN